MTILSLSSLTGPICTSLVIFSFTKVPVETVSNVAHNCYPSIIVATCKRYGVTCTPNIIVRGSVSRPPSPLVETEAPYAFLGSIGLLFASISCLAKSCIWNAYLGFAVLRVGTPLNLQNLLPFVLTRQVWEITTANVYPFKPLAVPSLRAASYPVRL